MKQNSAGQPAKKSPEPKEFLGTYSSAVEKIVKQAQEARNPSGFQRVANGAVGQTLSPDNTQYYT